MRAHRRRGLQFFDLIFPILRGGPSFSIVRCSMVSSKFLDMTAAPLSALAFRQALGQFATGVTVITVEFAPGRVHGMTANAFTSVSLEPFLVLVCIDQRAHMLPILHRKKSFGISVLKEGQQAISEFFAQPGQNEDVEDRLNIRFRYSPGGIPLLENTLAQLSCQVTASYVAGDHTIFLGEVETANINEGEPLLFFRGHYRQVAPLE
jgi:flavin reductase (DIM6/NTAB) family NADH-FMN oxidoreductase RutF